IELIERKIGLDNIPEKLQGLARLRLANPELSLKEVAEQVPDGPISKSGANHRFQKLHELAKSLGE
ncbi:DNA-binding protein WhiA, partial [Lactobacillus sp. XV13L]|nr:DNA-binding protein WhiA [Lactobacillus sp. XV13L]